MQFKQYIHPQTNIIVNALLQSPGQQKSQSKSSVFSFIKINLPYLYIIINYN